ncbi:MAG: DEAD/DEAH box helicase [Albidovulum sp.]|uniref:DEAD/DEAH box helicase n=1 Tax=Albidovulum sp. TaxID=1872424 RepID=UPI003CA8F39D
MNYFEELGIDTRVVANLTQIGLTEPTPIQTRAIPAALDGRDVMGLAQTGTGKTAAFGLPIVTKLLEVGRRPNPKTCRALILAPTRELATQITENMQKFAKDTPIRTFRVVGGASLNAQAQRLASGIDVLVATPGRLIDLLERKALKLNEVRYLVLDEADQMLDIGFIHALRQIARLLPTERQTMLFSATMPKLMDEIAASYLTNPIRVQVSPPGKVADKIEQGVHFINQGDKAKLLDDFLVKHPGELALVFGRTKHGSDKLMRLLESWGHKVGAIHGNKSQGQRERALQAFRNGEIKVLVATDVAARGIDIPDVRHVYNYDLPNVPENYVHRIGRTARAGKAGRAIAFCAPAEFNDLKAIEKVMKAAIPVIGGTAPSGAEANAAAKDAKAKQGQRQGRGAAHGNKQRPDGQAKRPARRPSRRPKRTKAA